MGGQSKCANFLFCFVQLHDSFVKTEKWIKFSKSMRNQERFNFWIIGCENEISTEMGLLESN